MKNEGDWFDRTDTPRDDLPVCLAVRNPETGRVGCWDTLREDTLTACGKHWGDDRHVTLMPELVTCSECRAFFVIHS